MNTDGFRWFFLDGDLKQVAKGECAPGTLSDAITGIESELNELPRRGINPTNHPYRLMIYQGTRVVAVRPADIGIC